jgi:heme exporter protein CcmB
VAARLWWIIRKDLLSEYRARQVWPAMLLLGVVVALVFGMQMQLPEDQKRRMVGGMLWLAVFFAGMLAVDRSMAAERDDGCWESLLLYPVSPGGVYLAKLAVNVVCLAGLQCLLVPLFVVLSDVPLLAHPGAMILVSILGNVGIAAVGTLVAAMTAVMRRSGNLSVLLVLPLAIPAVLAASEATGLVVDGRFDAAWWRWVQMLGVFAAMFVIAGYMLFEFVAEE